MRIVIIGGIAAGATAASKARRENEEAEIVLFERSPYISVATCGLPYYLSTDIKERSALLVTTAASFSARYRIQVHAEHEVLAINAAEKSVRVKNLRSGAELQQPYDRLIICSGAGPVVPPVDGVHARNIFSCRTIPDVDGLNALILSYGADAAAVRAANRRAVIIGGGFIGMEVAEAMVRRGLSTTVVDMADHLLPPFDEDMARLVELHVKHEGVNVVLSDGLASFKTVKAADGSETAQAVVLKSGRELPADVIVLSIGVRPEIALARAAGVTIGVTGGIAVDEHQRTSDPSIFAAGDACELVNLVTGAKARFALAGPANKQGRVAGANAAAADGAPLLSFKGALGTSIIETLGIAAGMTGLTERAAAAAGIPYVATLFSGTHHASYYPGARVLNIKLVAEKDTGRLLGAQVVGELNSGVDKRIDVCAVALHARMTVEDMEQLDTSYSPQVSSAKDPIVMAAMISADAAVRHSANSITLAELESRRTPDWQVLDVRTAAEATVRACVHCTAQIPVDSLRAAIEVPDCPLNAEKPVVLICRGGLRAYIACRILSGHGFKEVYYLTGGMQNPGMLARD